MVLEQGSAICSAPALDAMWAQKWAQASAAELEKLLVQASKTRLALLTVPLSVLATEAGSEVAKASNMEPL